MTSSYHALPGTGIGTIGAMQIKSEWQVMERFYLEVYPDISDCIAQLVGHSRQSGLLSSSYQA